MSAVALELRVARGATAQQAEIDAWLDARRQAADESAAAVVAEGAFFDLHVPEGIALLRLAPGCACCVGQLPLRVGLTRLLRERRPRSVLLLIAADEHRQRIEKMLREGALGVAFTVRTAGEEQDDVQGAS
ncbi:MAG: hypothetical protein LW847_09485 [Burkholderiales bacterium]|nr:hypothetical protein [Burkholderiales bacterium]